MWPQSAWLYVQTSGRLGLVTLWHFGFNFFPMFLDELPVTVAIWLQAIVTLVIALSLALFFGLTLQRSSAAEGFAADRERVSPI